MRKPLKAYCDSDSDSDSDYRRCRDSLEEVIAQQGDVSFNVHNWLKKLPPGQLRRIENDAQRCCNHNTFAPTKEKERTGLVDITLTVYMAENRFEVSMDEALEYLDNLLVGLAVIACIERLNRAGWVTIIGKMSIVLQDPRPYWVTQRGFKEGIWSKEPLTLWLLGTGLEIH